MPDSVALVFVAGTPAADVFAAVVPVAGVPVAGVLAVGVLAVGVPVAGVLAVGVPVAGVLAVGVLAVGVLAVGMPVAVVPAVVPAAVVLVAGMPAAVSLPVLHVPDSVAGIHDRLSADILLPRLRIVYRHLEVVNRIHGLDSTLVEPSVRTVPSLERVSLWVAFVDRGRGYFDSDRRPLTIPDQGLCLLGQSLFRTGPRLLSLLFDRRGETGLARSLIVWVAIS